MVWRLILIRHGMTEGNREKRYIGTTDESLCEEGRRVLEKRKAAGEYPEADVVFASPMRRCLETAELLYPGQEPVVIKDFRECDFGLFEGKNYRELTGNPLYQAWIDSGGELAFPQGESRKLFQDRCARGLEELAAVCRSRKDSGRGTETTDAALGGLPLLSMEGQLWHCLTDLARKAAGIIPISAGAERDIAVWRKDWPGRMKKGRLCFHVYIH